MLTAYFAADSLTKVARIFYEENGRAKDLSVKSRAAEEKGKQYLAMARILIDCAKLEGLDQSCLAPRKDST